MPKPVISHNLYIHLNIKMRQALEHKNRILSMRLDYSRTTFRLRMLRFDTLDDRQDRCLLDNYSIRRCLDPNMVGKMAWAYMGMTNQSSRGTFEGVFNRAIENQLSLMTLI